MVSFRLEKLKIHAFENRSRTGLPQETFEVMFNPESYSLQYENDYQAYQGINTSGREARYSLSKPTRLSLQIIFDNSGVVAASGIMGAALTGSALLNQLQGKNDVYKQVDKFLKLAYQMDGELHAPKFLKIEWGDLIFNCRLASINIAYTLFNRSGQPTRAELDTQFVGDIDTSKRLKKEQKASPDLTHQRVMKAGETLPLLAARTYNDPKYYIRLAQANQLNHFRKLKTGSAIKLPPIRKQSES